MSYLRRLILSDGRNRMGLRRRVFRRLTTQRHEDTPWIDPMSADYAHASSSSQHDGTTGHLPAHIQHGTPPTYAAFSPDQQTASGRRTRTSIIIHQKSPLLMATPPQVTRALAYSHPFILPLNHVLGLLSWTSRDPWESFLLLTSFWFFLLYGDAVTRWAGPIVVVGAMVIGMYSRRYSPLSSTTWSGHKKSHRRRDSEDVRKTLDEILETLQTFTARCDVLLDPFVRVTEFLSTQSTATSATTRPALTTLFVRILAFTPIWIALTLPPLYIITTKRLTLAVGTLILTWHSRAARVSRTVLWRSRTVRRLSTLITGLQFDAPALPPRPRPTVGNVDVAASAKKAKSNHAGVRFTFNIYENQRRWLGLGWTASLLAYERQAWTDEAQNTCPDPQNFPLPETDMASTKWRWVPGSEWKVESTTSKSGGSRRLNNDEQGWIYTDNKWGTPSKEDGWGKYTRRRKWARDAELVEVDSDSDSDKNNGEQQIPTKVDADRPVATTSITSNTTPQKRKGWLSRNKVPKTDIDVADNVSIAGTASTGRTTRSRDDPEDDVVTSMAYRNSGEYDRRYTDGLTEGLS